jgi:hypothetical protein
MGNNDTGSSTQPMYSVTQVREAMEFAALSMAKHTSIELLEDGYEKVYDTKSVLMDIKHYLAKM